MLLNTLGNVVAFLTDVKKHKEQFIKHSYRHNETIHFLAKRFNRTPEGMVNEIESEIHTLETAITILEKEQHDANEAR